MPFTLQGGNFQLVGGGPVANGTVTLALSINDGSATLIVGGGPAQITYILTLDANGNFTAGQVVSGNGEISPNGTFYTAVVKTSGGSTVGSPATWIVGPSSPYTGALFPNVTVLPPVSVSGVLNGAFELTGNSSLPAATNTDLWIAGAFGAPILGKIYVGDGTGWEFVFAKRVGSADTNLFILNDAGVFAFLTDTGFSRTAAGSLALGNGSAGNKSGILQLAAVQGPGRQKQIFTGSGTFTIPAGITQVKVTVIGGGGGGGSGVTSGAGGGGSSGGVAIKWLSGLTPGNTLAVTVGGGGSAGTAGGSGGAGTASQVASGTQTITTIVSGVSGGGFNGPTGNGNNGTTGSGGDINTPGSPGVSGVSNNGGPGGSGPFGGGGFGSGGGTGGGGTTNSGSGGGGGGGGAANNGGAGGSGIVIFEWVS